MGWIPYRVLKITVVLEKAKGLLWKPHNTLILFGSYGVIHSSEMFIIPEIASALIAGVIVVIVDWKNSASAAPQNQLHLAECTCRKSGMVGCDVIRGVGALKVLTSLSSKK